MICGDTVGAVRPYLASNASIRVFIALNIAIICAICVESAETSVSSTEC